MLLFFSRRHWGDLSPGFSTGIFSGSRWPTLVAAVMVLETGVGHVGSAVQGCWSLKIRGAMTPKYLNMTS